jgi:uncharacterized membrane protein
MNYILLLINIFLLVLGQAIWKAGASKLQFSLSVKGILAIFTNPYIISGGVVYVFATIIWIYLLSKQQLSDIYPLQSLCYVVAAIVGVTVFKESFSIVKVMGILLIVGGAFLVTIK